LGLEGNLLGLFRQGSYDPVQRAIFFKGSSHHAPHAGEGASGEITSIPHICHHQTKFIFYIRKSLFGGISMPR
jgi:hypothetical protein